MNTAVRRGEVTRLLTAISDGDRSSVDDLLPYVYREMRALAGSFMSRESRGHTLQPTELVHEAYIRLVDQTRVDWRGRTHFFAVAAQAMRRILVDHARRKHAAKRGGGKLTTSLDEGLPLSVDNEEDVLAIDEALQRLAALNERQAQVVELRFFGGLTVPEVSDALNTSTRTVELDWQFARAWLRRELASSPSHGTPQ